VPKADPVSPKDAVPSRWFPVVVLLLGFAVIAPALWSTWLGDDAFYSLLRGALKAEHATLGQAMAHSFRLWLLGNGRFYPGLIVEKYLVFYLFTDLVAYKLFLIVMTVLCVELFRRCVAAYATVAAGNLSALVVVTLFTERGYQDSILSYNGMPQVVALLVLASLLAYRRGLQEPNRLAYALAVVLYACAALTYEDVYPLCVLYPLLAAFSRKPNQSRTVAGLPFVAVALALAVFSLAMRRAVHLPSDSIYAFGLNPYTVARTGLEQIVAAFPLTYWGFDPSHIYGRSSLGDFFRNAPVSPALFVAFGLAAWSSLHFVRSDSGRPWHFVAIGAMVLVLPALPIAVTLKYQHELAWGLGYLPVFFEEFGLALIACGLAIGLVSRRASAPMRIAVSIAIALVATMTQATNVRLVREGWASRAARSALERQIATGLAAEVRDGDTIAVSRDFDWIGYGNDGPDGISTRFMFEQYGDRNVGLVAREASAARFVLIYNNEQSVWTLKRLHRTLPRR
jgi:hypothetical protein